MKRVRGSVIAALLIASLIGFLPAFADAPALSDKVAGEAQRIVSNVRSTHYQHDQVVDEANGVYDLDCSEFVSYVLQRVAPSQYAEVPKEVDEAQPRAFKYYEFFASLSTTPSIGWHAVDSMADAERGDILVWRTPELRKHHDTGHIVILAETPHQRDNGDWEVNVYDASEVRHYHDSRDKDGLRTTGVGTGGIRFHVDAAGHPTAFQFGPGDAFHEYPIVIARVEEMP